MVTWASGDDGDGQATSSAGGSSTADGTAVRRRLRGQQHDGRAIHAGTSTADGAAGWAFRGDVDLHLTRATGRTPDIRARLFNADGTAVGDDFVVNSTSSQRSGSVPR